MMFVYDDGDISTRCVTIRETYFDIANRNRPVKYYVD